MTQKEAYRYAELQRMDAEHVPIAEQAKRLGVTQNRIYGIRSEARMAGFKIQVVAARPRNAAAERAEAAFRRIDALMATVCPNPRCGTRGPHICVGRAVDYMRRQDEPYGHIAPTGKRRQGAS